MRSFFFFLLLVCWSLPINAGDLIPLKILVNTSDKGEFFVILEQEGEILVAKNDVQLLGIQLTGLQQEIAGQTYVSLRSMQPELTYKLNDHTLELHLTVSPLFLSKTMLNLIDNKPNNNFHLGIDSAFLNYSFIHRFNDEDGLRSFDAPLEGVISAHDWLFKSQFNYHYELISESEGKVYWQRGLTNITRDFPKKLDRFILGDFQAHSGELGGSGVFLGLSFQKKYSMASYFTKYPGLTINGVLDTPSQVDMYVNDILVRTEHLPSGRYEISNMPNLYGAGSVKLEVTDAFGRKKIEYVPYYVSTKLLRVGLADYSYNLGFERDAASHEQIFYASTPTFLGYHRWGLTRYLTAGYRFEFSQILSNAGLSATGLVGSLGEVEAGVSVSQFDAEQGTAGYFRYGFTSQYLHGRYSFKSVDQTFATLSTFESEVGLKESQSVGIGVHGLMVGSLAFNYTQTNFYSKQQTKSSSIIYSVRIAKRTSFLFRGVRTENEGGESDAVFASINTSFGRRTSANVSHSKQQALVTNSTTLQNSASVGTGVGYRLRVSEQNEESNKSDYLKDGSVQIKMKYLSVIGSVFQGELTDTYQSQIAGSMAFIDNDYFLARPIYDSFGLVKVDDLDNIRVYYGNELVDKTDGGKLIIPNLTSYADNRISIEPLDVPIERSLKETHQVVTPKFRTGSVASFEVDRFQGFSGTILIRQDGISKPAEYADLMFNYKGLVSETVIGRNGEFYFENLAVGNHQATITLKGEKCRFVITVPPSQETMVELGQHVCQS